MKVLYLTLGVPDPPIVGAQIRDFELYRRIAERHEVQVVALTESAPANPPREDRIGRVHPMVVPTALRPGLLARLPSHLKAGWPLATLPFVSATALAELRALVRRWAPDIIQVEHSFLAPYVVAVEADSRVRSVLSLHNLGESQFARMRVIARGMREQLGACLKARAMRGWEARWCSRFDRVVVVSEADRDRLRNVDPTLPIAVIPNGIDAGVATLPPAQGHALLFVGNLAYAPNVDAVRYFCEAVFPRVRRQLQNATFTAVGFDPPPSLLDLGRIPGVTVVSSAPDLQPHYQRASVCVVPLRAGGGTRLKILEAMALGRPVVSTSIGCEGLAVHHGEHLLVADDPASFARAVVRLCLDPDRAQQIVSGARRLCEERYNWDTLSDQLEGIYRGLQPA